MFDTNWRQAYTAHIKSVPSKQIGILRITVKPQFKRGEFSLSST